MALIRYSGWALSMTLVTGHVGTLTSPVTFLLVVYVQPLGTLMYFHGARSKPLRA